LIEVSVVRTDDLDSTIAQNFAADHAQKGGIAYCFERTISGIVIELNLKVFSYLAYQIKMLRKNSFYYPEIKSPLLS